MADGHTFPRGNFPSCERCRKGDSTAEIRPSDQFECDSCWYEKDDKLNSDNPGNSSKSKYHQYEPEEGSSSAMTVVQQADEMNESQDCVLLMQDHYLIQHQMITMTLVAL